MKAFKFLLFLLIFMIVAVIFTKNFVVKAGIEQGVKIVTGLPLKIHYMNINLRESSVHIQGFQLYNPPGFFDPIMLDVPEVYVNIDMLALLNRKIHVEEIRFHLKEFAVITNKDKELNLNKLKALQPPEDRSPAEESAPAEKQELPDIQIDSLQLKIDKVVSKDYSRGDKPVINEYTVGIDETIENIDDPYRLVQIIVFKSLIKTPLANLPALNMEELKSMVGDTIDTAKGLAQDIVDSTGDAIKGTVNEITDIIQLPFGSK